jgi:hypothetical protein
MDNLVLLTALRFVAFWFVIVQPANARICLAESKRGVVPCYIYNHAWEYLDELGLDAKSSTERVFPSANEAGRPTIEIAYTFSFPPMRNDELAALVARKKSELAAVSNAVSAGLNTIVCNGSYGAKRLPESLFVGAGGVIIYSFHLQADTLAKKIRLGPSTLQVVEIANVIISSCEAP